MIRMTLLLLFFVFAGVVFAQSDEAMLEKGKESLHQGSYDVAQKYLEPLVKKSLENAAPLVELYKTVGEYDKVLALTKQMMEKAQTALEGKLLFAEINLLLGRLDEAENALESAQKSKDSIRCQVLLGLVAYQKGDKARYLKYFSQVFDQYSPDQDYSAEELSYLGIACHLYAMKSDEVDRSDTLKTVIHDLLPGAIQKDKYCFDAYETMAQIFIEAFNTKDAKDIIEDALKLNPNHPRMLYCKALLELSDYSTMPQAMTTVKLALKFNPCLLEALDLAASISLADEEYSKCKEYLGQALRTNPKSLTTKSLQASLYYMENRLQAYEEEARQVLALNPIYGEFYYTVASMIGHKRQFSESVFLLRKAIKIDPFLWHAYIELGMNLMRVGEIEEAEKYFKKIGEEYNFHTQSHNMLILLKKYQEFKVFNTGNFTLRLHVSEAEAMKPIVSEVIEKAFATLTKKYNFKPQTPVLFEMFPTHDDFSVRTIGLDSLGASGACFGKVIAAVSPKSRKLGFFNWASVAWHEFAHVITLQLSDYQVPRWFTEGLSEFTEKERNPACTRNLDLPLYSIYTSGQMRKMETLNAGFTRPQYPMEIEICYYQAGLICTLIETEFGFDKIIQMLELYKQGKKDGEVFRIALGLTLPQFDQKFAAWLDKNIFSQMNVFPSIDNRQLARLQDVIDGPEKKTAETYIQVALAFLQRKKFVDAEQFANAVLSLKKGEAIAYDILGQIAFERQNHTKAQELLEKAVTLGSKNFHTLLMLASLYQSVLKNNEKAIEFYEKAKASYPNYLGPNNPYLQLAKIYQAQNKKAESLQEMEAYLAREGNDFKTRLDLAKEYFYQKKYDDSIRLLVQAQEIYPLSAELQSLLSKSYKNAEKWDLALRHYGIWLALDPKEEKAGIHADIAEIYANKQDLEKAKFHAEEALNIDPDSKRAQQILDKIQKSAILKQVAKSAPSFLSISLYDTEDPVQKGQDVVYVLGLTNKSNDVYSNVQVVNTITGNLRYGDIQAPIAHTIDGNTLRFSPIAKIAPGKKVLFMITCEAQASGKATFTVEVTYDGSTEKQTGKEVTTIE